MSAELTLDVDTREIGAILKEAAFSVGFKEDMSHILNIRPDQVSKRYDIEICAVCYVPRYVRVMCVVLCLCAACFDLDSTVLSSM
jgi:hypothetical protein